MSDSNLESESNDDRNGASRSGIAYWLYELDRILRGEATRPDEVEQADIKIPVIGISVVVVVLAVIYGFCMGIFALVHGFENEQSQRAFMQTFASMCKVPLLFFLTLLVTFPSLYVFNALVGSQLRIGSVLKLLIASLAINLTVLASMGPILAFFSVSTPSYPFIVLLNVLLFATSGALGLSFLIQTLNRLTVSTSFSPAIATDAGQQTIKAPPAPRKKIGPLDRPKGVALNSHVRTVFTVWIIVFGLVGAQMGWVLRPFIGSPDMPFQWFRERDSNFFEAVFQQIFFLMGG